MRYFLILFLFYCLPSAHAGEPWTEWDATRQTTYTLLHLVDWGQTLEASENPDLEERNPILGKHPSRTRINNYFTITLIGHWMITDYLDPPYRKWWQWFWIAVEADAVNHNYKMGVRLVFD